MLWVTREYVHLDRVACPWLITRFIDPEATFVFVPWLQEHLAPSHAIPFSMPGAKLGPHDADGSTFRKIIAEYRIDDHAVARIGHIVDLCVAHVVAGYRPEPDDEDGQIAVGLLALAEGTSLLVRDDDAILQESFPLFDALHARFRMLAIAKARGLEMPDGSDGRGPSRRFELTRTLFDELQR